MENQEKPWEQFQKRHEDPTGAGNPLLAEGVAAGQDLKSPAERKQEARHRSRSRGPSLSVSPHRDEYMRLLLAGWGSLSLESYARHRYGETIPASTFRSARKKAKVPEPKSLWDQVDPEKPVDVVQLRNELIQLQQSRIAIDVKHEQQMGKLFGSTKGEIALLSELLAAQFRDLQDLGLMPKGTEKLEVSQPSPQDAPRYQSLGEALGAENVTELARYVHELGKRANGKGRGDAC